MKFPPPPQVPVRFEDFLGLLQGTENDPALEMKDIASQVGVSRSWVSILLILQLLHDIRIRFVPLKVSGFSIN